MSDEFIKVATQEINDELSSIATILDTCSNDVDVIKNSDKMEQQMHKQFYCKICRGKRMFVSHVQYPNKFICQSCRFTTSNPIKNPKMQDKKTVIVIRDRYRYRNRSRSRSRKNIRNNLPKVPGQPVRTGQTLGRLFGRYHVS